MRFLSVCSGIEAASVAWNPLGWEAAAFSEIEPFPCSVLAHHYPTVPNLGDMTKYEAWPDATVDLLCGGTPCQSFSVAGLRKGLADPRGNLMLTYGAIAARYRPRWLVWENVPGVLSSNGGRDFGTFLGMLGQLGYGFAYRVLDAQYFGVAQRRRRVFVVGCLGDWRRAAAVLFERHSLSGHPAPSRKAREGLAALTAPSLTASGRGVERTGESRGQDPVVAVHCADVAPTLNAAFGSKLGLEDQHIRGGVDCSLPATSQCITTGTGQRYDPETETLIPTIGGGFDGPYAPEVAGTLVARSSRGGGQTNSPGHNADKELVVTHSLTGEGFDASEDGTGRGTPLVPIAFDSKASQQFTSARDCSPTLRSMNGDRANGGGQVAVALALRGREGGATAELGDEVQNALRASSGGGDKAHILAAMQVRRLTPRECERLQGFPDDYTLVPHRGKPAADGPRYKALGNSWAVPNVRWIGARINQVEALHRQREEIAA